MSTCRYDREAGTYLADGEPCKTDEYGAVEPGSQIEFNPDCPSHGTTTTHPTASAGLAGTEGERDE